MSIAETLFVHLPKVNQDQYDALSKPTVLTNNLFKQSRTSITLMKVTFSSLPKLHDSMTRGYVLALRISFMVQIGVFVVLIIYSLNDYYKIH